VPFLSVIERELRVAARKPGTYWGRIVTALVGAAIWWCIASGWSNIQMAGGGNVSFSFLAYLLYLASLLSGLWFTADTLARERREGTLGLLFLTDLKTGELILGKFVGASLNAAFGLVAALPVLAVTFLLGGVTDGELIRVSLALCNVLFFSLALCFVISAFCSSNSTAIRTGFTVLMLAGVVLPLAAIVSRSIGSQLYALLSWVPPSGLIRNAFESRFLSTPSEYWGPMAATHVLGWCSIIVAGFATRWFSRERSTPMTERWKAASPARLAAEDASRLERRKQLHLENPITWLHARNQRTSLVARCAILVGIAVVWVVLLRSFGAAAPDIGLYVVICFTLHSCLKFWVASAASRCLAEDGGFGALELVLVTGVSVKTILDGLIKFLVQRFAIPMVLFLGFDAWILALIYAAGQRSEIVVVQHLAAMAFLLVDSIAIASGALWLGLKTGQSGRAALASFALVVILPLVVLYACPFLGLFRGSGDTILTCFIISCLLWDALLIRASFSKLRDQFRALASRDKSVAAAITAAYSFTPEDPKAWARM
jgi:ABC-type transport system involved in multi-copper enzyme maturation permease subunit